MRTSLGNARVGSTLGSARAVRLMHALGNTLTQVPRRRRAQGVRAHCRVHARAKDRRARILMLTLKIATAPTRARGAALRLQDA
mmetsp:Transcript_24437/g.53322  ORF Transcript_24437/g.53322 Transcript_24437/m.53322 type:complete len:84 (-) Transcript_24437:776-1027(-)